MRLPDRLASPLAPAQQYVARRVGLADAGRDQRLGRDLARQPRPDTRVSIQSLGQAPPDVSALEVDQLYRVQGGPGVADTLVARLKDASDTTTMMTLAATVGTLTLEVTPVLHAYTIGPTTGGEYTVVCPAGKQIVGGGWFTSAVDVYVYQSYPESNGWRVGVWNLGAGSITVTAHALCVELTGG